MTPEQVGERAKPTRYYHYCLGYISKKHWCLTEVVNGLKGERVATDLYLDRYRPSTLQYSRSNDRVVPKDGTGHNFAVVCCQADERHKSIE